MKLHTLKPRDEISTHRVGQAEGKQAYFAATDSYPVDKQYHPVSILSSTFPLEPLTFS